MHTEGSDSRASYPSAGAACSMLIYFIITCSLHALACNGTQMVKMMSISSIEILAYAGSNQYRIGQCRGCMCTDIGISAADLKTGGCEE